MSQNSTISIPMSEYVRLCELDGLESKAELIKVSKEYIATQQTDLDRYKKKAALLDKELKRTQKQLDIFLNRGVVPTRPESIDDDEELLAREASVGTCPQRPSENILAQVGNLPMKQNLINSQQQSTNRSHSKQEKSNKRTSEAPGVSIVLLKKLVQDNLKLQERVRQLENGTIKPNEKSNSDSENILSRSTSDNRRSLKSGLDSGLLTFFQQENEKLKKELEENKKYAHKLHRELTNLKNSDHMDRQIREANDARKLLTERLKTVQDMLDKTRTQLQDSRNENTRLKANYVRFVDTQSPYGAKQPRDPSVTAPHPRIDQPDRAVQSASVYSAHTRPHFTTRTEHQDVRKSPVPAQRRRPAPTQTSPHPTPTTPARTPSESSASFSCPRCDKPFNAKDEYGSHIRQCLKG